MGRIILITGGTRSGKSDYAQYQAENLPEPRCFVATSTAVDREMEERIKKHVEARKSGKWQTIEEPVNLEYIFKGNRHYKTILVDCITLWVSNVMEKAFKDGVECDEDYMVELLEKILKEVEKSESTILFVTNEVGMGIVPHNKIARRYRDLVGRCNRVLAASADEVVLVSCGLPMILKKTNK